METRICTVVLPLLLLFSLPALATATADVCPRVIDLGSIVGPPSDSCARLDDERPLPDLIGVVGGDETALQRALIIVHKNKDKHVAVLFYASWCPFSKLCLPNFNYLSSLFPTIRHFAFEESRMRPSTLSRYGVHGFPTLFLLNSTIRVRYHGPRTIKSLMAFYNDVTGVRPTSMELKYVENVSDKLYLSEFKEDVEQEENCPFSWARSPEKLLQQHTYLALASSFLVMRLLYILLPKLNACIRHAWRQMNDNLEQAKQGFKRLNPWKRSNLQGGALNAKAWASKSLASVSIGEPSSVRTHSSGETR